MAANECTSVAGHFDGHGGTPVQYGAHHPMQNDQGFTGSHWTPPLGKYLLCISQAVARATINSMMMHHLPTLLAALMAIAMRRYYTACTIQWRRFVAFVKATKHHHRMSACSDIPNRTRQLRLFRTFHHEKERQLTCWPRITIGV